MLTISLRLPDDLATAIDKERGEVARERWIRNALRAALIDPAAKAPEPAPQTSRTRR